MRAPGRVALLAVVGALAPCAGLAACGESHPARTTTGARAVTQLAQPTNPRAVVAQVGPYSITEATLERFTRARLGGEPASERLVPPRFSACVAHLQAESASRDEPAPGSAQLRRECQTRYEKLREAALEGLITDDWLIGGARELGVSVSKKTARTAVERNRRAHFSRHGQLQRFLAVRTVGDLIFEAQAKLAAARIREAVEDRVPAATPAQITSYYRQHSFQYLVDGERDVRIARTQTMASAGTVRAHIASGESFASAVRSLRVRQADNSSQGLVLGLRPHEYGEPKLNEAIFTAKPSVLAGPVSTWYGYFVFEVTSVQSQRERPLDDVRASISHLLTTPRRAHTLATFFGRWRAAWTARTSCSPAEHARDCRG